MTLLSWGAKRYAASRVLLRLHGHAREGFGPLRTAWLLRGGQVGPGRPRQAPRCMAWHGTNNTPAWLPACQEHARTSCSLACVVTNKAAVPLPFQPHEHPRTHVCAHAHRRANASSTVNACTCALLQGNVYSWDTDTGAVAHMYEAGHKGPVQFANVYNLPSYGRCVVSCGTKDHTVVSHGCGCGRG